MNAKAIVCAGIGAVIGALAWGAVTYWTGYEIGYLAWGLGLLVGFGGGFVGGGSGRSLGVVCAVLALGSIFAGKMMAIRFAAPEELRKIAYEQLTPDAFAEAQRDAGDFAQIKSEDQYAEYMVSHGFTEADEADSVSAEELDEFVEQSVPNLREFNQRSPGLDAWREERAEEFADSVVAELSITDAVVEDLSVIDIVFAALGLMTAYKLGFRGGLADD